MVRQQYPGVCGTHPSVFDTHSLITSVTLIDEMGISDRHGQAAPAGELAKGKVEGDVSTKAGILLANLFPPSQANLSARHLHSRVPPKKP